MHLGGYTLVGSSTICCSERNFLLSLLRQVAKTFLQKDSHFHLQILFTISLLLQASGFTDLRHNCQKKETMTRLHVPLVALEGICVVAGCLRSILIFSCRAGAVMIPLSTLRSKTSLQLCSTCMSSSPLQGRDVHPEKCMPRGNPKPAHSQDRCNLVWDLEAAGQN